MSDEETTLPGSVSGDSDIRTTDGAFKRDPASPTGGGLIKFDLDPRGNSLRRVLKRLAEGAGYNRARNSSTAPQSTVEASVGEVLSGLDDQSQPVNLQQAETNSLTEVRTTPLDRARRLLESFDVDTRSNMYELLMRTDAHDIVSLSFLTTRDIPDAISRGTIQSTENYGSNVALLQRVRRVKCEEAGIPEIDPSIELQELADAYTNKIAISRIGGLDEAKINEYRLRRSEIERLRDELIAWQRQQRSIDQDITLEPAAETVGEPATAAPASQDEEQQLAVRNEADVPAGKDTEILSERVEETEDLQAAPSSPVEDFPAQLLVEEPGAVQSPIHSQIGEIVDKPSRDPDQRMLQGDLWEGRRLGREGGVDVEGTQAKIYNAIFQPKGEPPQAAIIKKTTLPEHQRSDPQRLVSDILISRLGIAGLPRLFAGGWTNMFNRIAELNDSGMGGTSVSIMERINTKMDQAKASSTLFNPERRQEIEPSRAEAILYAEIYYFTYIASTLYQNGWLFPYDFYLSGPNIYYDDSSMRLRALDFGTADPIARETAQQVVSELGGEKIFDEVRRATRVQRVSLEQTYRQGTPLSELQSNLDANDTRGQLISQIIRLVLKHGMERKVRTDFNNNFQDGLSLILAAGNPSAQKLYDLLSEVFSSSRARNGWMGLEEAFRQALLGSDQISDSVRQNIIAILANTGIAEFQRQTELHHA